MTLPDITAPPPIGNLPPGTEAVAVTVTGTGTDPAIVEMTAQALAGIAHDFLDRAAADFPAEVAAVIILDRTDPTYFMLAVTGGTVKARRMLTHALHLMAHQWTALLPAGTTAAHVTATVPLSESFA